MKHVGKVIKGSYTLTLYIEELHFSYQSNPGGGSYPSRRSSLAMGSISDLAKPTNWVFVLPYLLVHLSILMCN